MIRVFIIACLVLRFEAAPAQLYDPTLPRLATKGKTPGSFVPSDWELHTVVDGFLNDDRFRDYAFVLENKEAVTLKDEFGDEKK